MNMTEETRQALIDSIEHWRRLEQCETPEEFQAEGYVSSSCALCQIFVEASGSCDGCPVADHTGYMNCDGSPWHSAFVRISRFIRGEGDISDALDAAYRERRFLESLLPEDEE